MVSVNSRRLVGPRHVRLACLTLLVAAMLSGCGTPSVHSSVFSPTPPASPSDAGTGSPAGPVDSRTPHASPQTPEPSTVVPTDAAPLATLPPTAPAEPTNTPQSLAASPTAPLRAEVLSITLYEELDMVPGQRARLTGTGIEVTLVEAHGPAEGCQDCPSQAMLEVSCGTEAERLNYSLSGMMVLELLERARRKPAFGYVFVAGRITEGEFTLIVEPETE